MNLFSPTILIFYLLVYGCVILPLEYLTHRNDISKRIYINPLISDLLIPCPQLLRIAQRHENCRGPTPSTRQRNGDSALGLVRSAVSHAQSKYPQQSSEPLKLASRASKTLIGFTYYNDLYNYTAFKHLWNLGNPPTQNLMNLSNTPKPFRQPSLQNTALASIRACPGPPQNPHVQIPLRPTMAG